MEQRLPVKVYYEDTDCLGVVYHANYLKFFERGRSEFISARGKEISVWNDEGVIFAVFKMEVTFHLAARLGDRCEVVTRLVPGSPYRMKMDQKLMRGDELLTEAMVDVVCLDADFELREFPEVLLDDFG
ncbi:MAG: YbgC/FadM family acyl-CoA thioesterase [Deltaproteobacteria bacterium]|nr:YbgC/FadM family acyl-CoA thioesterase [Deltaproteobacteria bacterium]